MSMNEDARFWVNDYGVTASGTVVYPGNSPDATFVGFVGIVDEQDGGMVAYASPAVADKLVDLLNREDA